MPAPARPELSPAIKRRLRRVRLVVSDVDGVLTDGGVYVSEGGGAFKRFDIHDGLGIAELLRAGVRMAWLSGDTSSATAARAKQLGVTDVRQGVTDKSSLLDTLARDHGVVVDDMLYIGDDLTDVAAIERSGFGVAVASARPEVRAAASLTTRMPGGYGAVREVIDLLLSVR